MSAESSFSGPQPGPNESSSEALRHDAERFRVLVENSRDLFIEVTPDGQVLYVSPNVLVALGFQSGELVGTNICDLVHPDDLRGTQMRSTFPAGCEVTCRYRRKDGAWSWFEIVERDYAGDQSEQRVVLVARDVTRTRTANAERDRLEAELRKAEKLTALGTLAGGIAHDFNNMLTAMMAYASLAQAEAHEPTVIDSLTQVLKAAERAKNLSRQILTFGCPQKQVRQPLPLAGVVQEVLKLLRPTFPANLEVVTDLREESGLVAIDSTQIHQVLVNLCTNAVHAMQDRPGRLEIRVAAMVVDEAFVRIQPGLCPGPYVRLSVIDTGHGMDADTRRRIFEPLFSTKNPSEGTGLGLAVVQRIVSEHGGAIQVLSRPGEGSAFHVFFPICRNQLHSTKLKPQLRGSGQRILFVDDEIFVCSIAAKILEAANYAVITYRDPQQALNFFRVHPEEFDLVIADLAMPGLTGLDLAAEILALRPRLPVLLTSGAFGAWTIAEAKRVGVHRMLAKPFTLAGLLEAVGGALHGEKSAAICRSNFPQI